MKPEFVEVNGKRVAFRAAGSGPAAILLTGLGLSSRFYQANIEGIAQRGIRIIVPDLPGFGGTRGKVTGLTVQETADFAVSFAAALSVQRATWIGHSVGSQAALLVAAQHAERTSGVILTAPTGASRRRLLHQLGALARVTVHESARVIGAVARDYIRTTPLHYAGWWLKAGRDHPLDHAPRVKAPVLILLGAEDPVPPPEFIAELQQRLPQATVERVAGGFHALPLEKPAEFNRIVCDFVLRCAAK